MHIKANRLSRFALVGSGVFLVDGATLLLLYGLLPLPLARALALWAAVSSNWYCNRLWTFSDRPAVQKGRQYRQFLLSSSIAFVPNWAISLLTLSLPRPTVFEQLGTLANPTWVLVAMAPGILAGMLINYQLSDRWVFPRA